MAKEVNSVKFEIRNPKFETNPKFQCSNFQNIGFDHWDFGHWKIVSICDIRISDLKRLASTTFLLIFMICLVSCSKPLYKRKFVISGTYLEVISSHPQAAGIVYKEFKRLDKIFNIYDSESEISRLNHTYNIPFKVSKDMIEILKLSKELENLTEGAFDISYGTLYDFWKDLITKKEGKVFSDKKISELKKEGGFKYIEINADEGTVTIQKQGIKIDLGGIAKGYMVDKAIFKLKEKGINSALINAGGDIYCLGTNRGKPWRVGIKDPEELKGIIEAQVLVDEAIATSGNYEQFFEYENKRYSHLIDPHTGYPVQNNILSVSVISKNCTTADSLATAFSVMGLEGIQKFLSQNPSTMRIFVVTKDEKGKHTHLFGPWIR